MLNNPLLSSKSYFLNEKAKLLKGLEKQKNNRIEQRKHLRSQSFILKNYNKPNMLWGRKET